MESIEYIDRGLGDTGGLGGTQSGDVGPAVKDAAVDTRHHIERCPHDVLIGEIAVNTRQRQLGVLQRRLDSELSSHVMGARGDGAERAPAQDVLMGPGSKQIREIGSSTAEDVELDLLFEGYDGSEAGTRAATSTSARMSASVTIGDGHRPDYLGDRPRSCRRILGKGPGNPVPVHFVRPVVDSGVASFAVHPLQRSIRGDTERPVDLDGPVDHIVEELRPTKLYQRDLDTSFRTTVDGLRRRERGARCEKMSAADSAISRRI